MSDDSFIREVNEELRQEKARALWGRYGPLLILAAILIVLATAAYQIFSYWQDNKAGHIGDNFLASLQLVQSNDFEGALQKLNQVEESKFGAYPYLAQMQKASILLEQGQAQQAIDAFVAIAQNKSTPEIIQKIANLRAAYILVDTGSFEDVEKHVKAMATDIDPMRMAAREALGFASYKAENYQQAMYYFQKNADEAVVGTQYPSRANMMLELMKSRGQDAVKG